jgi:hypothetical protein
MGAVLGPHASAIEFKERSELWLVLNTTKLSQLNSKRRADTLRLSP